MVYNILVGQHFRGWTISLASTRLTLTTWRSKLRSRSEWNKSLISVMSLLGLSHTNTDRVNPGPKNLVLSHSSAMYYLLQHPECCTSDFSCLISSTQWRKHRTKVIICYLKCLLCDNQHQESKTTNQDCLSFAKHPGMAFPTTSRTSRMVCRVEICSRRKKAKISGKLYPYLCLQKLL